MNSYSDLSEEARKLIESQLSRLRNTLAKDALTHQEAKTLLEIAKWLSEMAFIEKDEWQSMSEEERKRLKEREKKRAFRLKQNNENKGQNQGDSEEEAAEGASSESSDCP